MFAVGNPSTPPLPLAGYDGACKCERAAQKSGDALDFAFAEGSADGSAADGLTLRILQSVDNR